MPNSKATSPRRENNVKISEALSNTAPIALLYGPEGRGKTTFVCKAHKPVAILTERGLPKGVRVDAVEDVNSFENILGVLRDLYADARGYKTLIIDTMDALEVLLIEHVCTRNGWKNIEQPAYGKGFVIADAEWQRFIRAITAIRDKNGMTILMTCHAEVVTVNDPRAPSYSSYQPKLHKRGRGLVMDACDAVLFISEDLRVLTDNNDRVRATAGPQRYLFCEGTPAFAAKNRFAMPSKIALPADLPFDVIAQYWAPSA
jgi:hypothetical protein